MIVKSLLLMALISLASLCNGQNHSLPPTTFATTVQPDIPTHTLDFEALNPTPGVAASPFIVLPTQCNSEGTLYLNMFDPSDPRRHVFYGIKRDTGTAFTTATISDLRDIEFISAYASNSMVGFLVKATRKAGRGQRTLRNSKGQTSTITVNPNPHHFYIAEFNLDGVYQQSVELQIDNPAYHFAILSSGKFLVTTYDRNADAPHLLLLDSSGEFLHQIEMPANMRTLAKSSNNTIKAAMASASLMGSLLFASYGSDVLAWRAGTNAPILEIQPGGSIQELKVAAPKGYVLADMVSSNDRMVAHFQPNNLDLTKAQNVAEYRYYEVNPDDGTLMVRLEIAGGEAGSIACEHGGGYVSFRTNKKGQFILLTTE